MCYFAVKLKLIIPQISHNWKTECLHRDAVPGFWLQSEKAVDEAAKKQAENTLF